MALTLEGTFAGRTCFEDLGVAEEVAEPVAIAREVSDHSSEVVDQLRSGHSPGVGHRHRDLRHTGSHTEDPEVVA